MKEICIIFCHITQIHFIALVSKSILLYLPSSEFLGHGPQGAASDLFFGNH